MIYQPVEYIENTTLGASGAYLILSDNFTYDDNVRFVGEFQYNAVPSGTGSIIFGGVLDGAQFCFFGTNGNQWRYSWSSAQSYGAFDQSKHILDISNGNQKIDEEIMSTDSQSINGNDVLYLFCNKVRTAYYNGRIYWFKVYRGSSLIYDLVPVYNIFTGEIGMYDLISNQFFTNAGTGIFLKGADI